MSQHVAIAGATGAVGTEFLKLLEVSGVIEILFSGLISFVDPTFIRKINLVELYI